MARFVRLAATDDRLGWLVIRRRTGHEHLAMRSARPTHSLFRYSAGVKSLVEPLTSNVPPDVCRRYDFSIDSGTI
jgi:hypothetical protein